MLRLGLHRSRLFQRSSFTQSKRRFFQQALLCTPGARGAYLNGCVTLNPLLIFGWLQLTIQADITIRAEESGDIDAIRAVTKAAFCNHPYSSQTEHHIVDSLRKNLALTLSLVAIHKDRLLGHIAISPVSISDHSTGWYALGPVSVSPDVQRQGIGSALIFAALARMKEQRALGCVLLGDPDYYHKFGFRCYEEVTSPGLPAEYFQVKPFTKQLPGSKVFFHKSFEATGRDEWISSDRGEYFMFSLLTPL